MRDILAWRKMTFETPSQSGITVLLTTHYMEEADTLANRLAIMDHGRIVAQGRPSELKNALKGDIVTVEFASAAIVSQAQNLLKSVDGITGVIADTTFLVAQVPDGTIAVPRIVEALRAEGIPLDRVSLQRPTLDEVYLSVTGRKYRPGAPRPQFFYR